jgi:tRNA(His) guanylyltransferase
MHFDELDSKMRVFETINDHRFLPEINLVIRLDGRGFTKLTANTFCEKPFDNRFHEAMVKTTEHLMQSTGFDFIFGYTQSDEISLLFDLKANLFERKERKLVSILAGEASAAFTIHFGKLGVFDARVCQLPTKELVVDYFRWRQEDAVRNALNGYCYWKLRDEGKNGTQASKQLERLSIADKNELLYRHGINFNDVTPWHKRGIGIYWETYEKEGYNPKLNEKVLVNRRRLKLDDVIPDRDAYSNFIRNLLDNQPRP